MQGTVEQRRDHLVITLRSCFQQSEEQGPAVANTTEINSSQLKAFAI